MVKLNERFEIYKIAVSSAEKNSERREGANRLYISLNTIVTGVILYRLNAPVDEVKLPDFVFNISLIFGICVSILWFLSMRYYTLLNKVKFQLIHKYEQKLSLKFFTDEYAKIKDQHGIIKHIRLGNVEQTIAAFFAVVYLVFAIAILQNWL